MLHLSGCASQVTKMSIPGIERSESVQIKDLRPVTEKQGQIFSLIISNDGYATYRIAETALTPSAIRLLQHHVYEIFSPAGESVDAKVHHFVIYRNLQAESRRGAIGVGLGGIIGAVVAGQIKSDPSGTVTSQVAPQSFNALESTEYKRALYSEEENPGHGSVHIIYIETEINGRRIFTRTITPIRPNDPEPLATAVKTSIQYHSSLFENKN